MEVEWITDRKPDKTGDYLVTLPDGNNGRYVDIESFYADNEEKDWSTIYNVLAWAELPEPYDGEVEEKMISVSWIRKWVEENSYLNKNICQTTSVDPKVFVRMVLDWEKENEMR